MSYRLFDQGYTAQEIQERKRAGIVERNEAEEMRLFKESEHRLNVMRGIKAWNELLDEEVKKRWREFMKGK